MTESFLTKRYKLSLTHSIPADFALSGKSGIHGHDFYIEVTMSLKRVALSQPSFQLCRKLDMIMSEVILRPLEGRYLNETVNTATGERLAEHIYEIIRRSEIGADLCRVELAETRKNRFRASKCNLVMKPENTDINNHRP